MYHDHPTHIATPARRVLVPRTGPGLDRHPVSGLRGSIPHELFLFCYLPHQYHLKSPQVRYLGKVVSQSPNLSCVPASTTVNINTTKQKEKKRNKERRTRKKPRWPATNRPQLPPSRWFYPLSLRLQTSPMPQTLLHLLDHPLARQHLKDFIP